jgi:toxin ParE1/3/4
MSDRVIALAQHPLLGRVVPDLGELGFREVLVAPYRIIYRLDLATHLVLIVRVWHARRAMQTTEQEGSTLDE